MNRILWVLAGALVIAAFAIFGCQQGQIRKGQKNLRHAVQRIDSLAQANHRAIQQNDLRRALLVNCQRDLSYKRQYKKRAEVEKDSLKVQAGTDQTLADVSRALAHGDPRTNMLLRRLAHSAAHAAHTHLRLRKTIHIIPLKGYCLQIQAAGTGPALGWLQRFFPTGL